MSFPGKASVAQGVTSGISHYVRFLGKRVCSFGGALRPQKPEGLRFMAYAEAKAGGRGRFSGYLSLHCHHQNDFCNKMGSDNSRFNVS